MAIRRIAVEEAFVTREIADEWDKVLASKFVEPGFLKMGQSILAKNAGTKALHERLLDMGAGRIARMDADGIDLAVLSLTSPGVQVLDAVTATALAAQSNDALAAAVKKYPTRFAGLAAVAPQYPKGAVAELERAAGPLALKGAIINSHTQGEYLDDRKYWPILEAAESLSLPIYLHPREPAPSMVAPFLDYGLYFAGWGFAVETGLHAMRLIMSGVFERFPKLLIVLGHMGEGVPFWLQRIDNRYLLEVKLGAVEKLPRLPSEYFRDNFVITTSGVTFGPALRLAVDVLGADRILFAADYPYEVVAEAVTFLDGASISEEERAKIYWQNATQVFRLG
jgi:2,3-dihydroxybenzoate decarboxylase